MFESDDDPADIKTRLGEERRARKIAEWEARKWGPHFNVPSADVARADKREWHLQTSYDMSTFEYEERYTFQDGCCAVCGAHKELDGVGPIDRLHVDHDHSTGANRDLLCLGCNTGIGNFRDSPEICLAAAAYLRRHNELEAVA